MAEGGQRPRLIDLDVEAIPYGRALAESFGLQDRVHFIQGDARRIRQTIPGVVVQIAELVGIIEYLNDDQLVELLKAVSNVMTPNGHLVTHGFVDKYRTGRFLTRVFGLRHYQRDSKSVSKLLSNSGFQVIECEYEPAGIHPIITAIRND